jgi:hypothetical protein
MPAGGVKKNRSQVWMVPSCQKGHKDILKTFSRFGLAYIQPTM